MQRHTRYIISGLIAALVLAAAVGTAQARRLALSEQFFLSHFPALTFEGSSINIACAVSIEGSFHSRTIEKVARALIGYISEVRIKRPCTGGEAIAVTRQERGGESLPWHILYERFIGALPNIEGIELTLDNPLFLVSIGGVPCQYRANTSSPMRGIVNREAGGKVTELLPNTPATNIPKIEGSAILCPSTGTLKAVRNIVGTQVGYREITVTLVA